MTVQIMAWIIISLWLIFGIYVHYTARVGLIEAVLFGLISAFGIVFLVLISAVLVVASLGVVP